MFKDKSCLYQNLSMISYIIYFSETESLRKFIVFYTSLFGGDNYTDHLRKTEKNQS